MVHKCYSIATYKKAYAYNLAPLRSRCHWEKQRGVHVHPPLYTKVMGRPKKNRRKTPEEKEKNGAKIITRAGVAMHCSICKRANHNTKGHTRYMEQLNNGTIQQEEADEEQDISDILQATTILFAFVFASCQYMLTS